MHDAVVVQVLERQHRLGEVQAGHVHGQRAHVLQERGAVAAWERGGCSHGARANASPPAPRPLPPDYAQWLRILTLLPAKRPQFVLSQQGG